MHRGQRERNVDLLVVLLYFTAQLTGISNAGDICSDEELTATFEVQSIYSPNFPNTYPNDVYCTTLITSPENTIIELVFDYFHLEFAKRVELCKDSLSITSGTHILMQPECHENIVWPHYPDKVLSTSNDMTITFVTDGEISEVGFDATFRAVQPIMPPQLVIMAENSTIRITQRYNQVHFDVQPNGIIDPLAVDYDPRSQYLYYSDRETHIIGRISIEVPDNGSVLHSENILEPFGMRIDVNSRLLYWTDAELGTISVSNLDGEYRNTIIDTDLNKPGAIVTEPYKGYIYFTDWGSDPKIERAEGDGKNRLVLANSDIVSPRSLTIDLEERALYWIDAVTNNLERINFDGTSRKMLRNLFHEIIFSLALDDNAFFCNGYYSPEPENGYIHLFDRDLQTSGHYVRWGYGKYYKGISLRPHRESDDFVPDTCPSADCKGLCLPRPNGHHTCLKGEDATNDVAVGIGPTLVLLGLFAATLLTGWVCKRGKGSGCGNKPEIGGNSAVANSNDNENSVPEHVQTVTSHHFVVITASKGYVSKHEHEAISSSDVVRTAKKHDSIPKHTITSADNVSTASENSVSVPARTITSDDVLRTADKYYVSIPFHAMTSSNDTVRTAHKLQVTEPDHMMMSSGYAMHVPQIRPGDSVRYAVKRENVK